MLERSMITCRCCALANFCTSASTLCGETVVLKSVCWSDSEIRWIGEYALNKLSRSVRTKCVSETIRKPTAFENNFTVFLKSMLTWIANPMKSQEVSERS